MTTYILIACSILVISALSWLFRRRLTRRIPKAIRAGVLLTSLVVLAVVGLLLDVVCLFCLITTIGHHRLLGIVLAATAAVCIGCSKQAEPAKPQPIQWSAADGGYHAETTAPAKGASKKEP
jgi:peptidoglycan/LPS O-acetylase OafA/YrhL